MQETYEFLKEKTKVNFIATIDGTKPSNRPFGAQYYLMTKFIFLLQKIKTATNNLFQIIM